MSSNWYFAKSGISNGPVSLDDLRRDLQSGVLGTDTLVWNASIPNWRPASEMAELRVSPPPLPPRQAAGAPDIAPVSLTEPRRGTSAPWSPHSPPETRPTQPQSWTGLDGLYIGAPARGFGEAISTCFSKYATFSGRASRSEYWYFYLFGILIGLIGGFIEVAGSPAVSGLISLVLMLPSLAVTVRRLHDTDRSGWWLGGPVLGLLGAGILIALIGASARNPDDLAAPFLVILVLGYLGWTIALTVFMCFKGTPGPNRFG